MIIIAMIVAILLITTALFIFSSLLGGSENLIINCYSCEAQEIIKQLLPNAKLLDKKHIPEVLDYLRLSKTNEYETELTCITNNLCNRGIYTNQHKELYDSFKKNSPDYNCALQLFYVRDLFALIDKRALYSKEFKKEYLQEFTNVCKEQNIPVSDSTNYTGKIITETITDVFHMTSVKQLLDFVLDFGFNSHVYFFAEKQNSSKSLLVSITNKAEPLNPGSENQEEIKKLSNLLSKIPLKPLGKSKSFYHIVQLYVVDTNAGIFIERIDFNPSLSEEDIKHEITKFVSPVFKV